MRERTKYNLQNFAVGALGGAVVAGVAWFAINRALNAQFNAGSAEIVTRGSTELHRVIETEIPARVRQTIDERFAEAGITRDTGRQLDAVLDLIEQTGLLNQANR